MAMRMVGVRVEGRMREEAEDMVFGSAGGSRSDGATEEGPERMDEQVDVGRCIGISEVCIHT